MRIGNRHALVNGQGISSYIRLESDYSAPREHHGRFSEHPDRA